MRWLKSDHKLCTLGVSPFIFPTDLDKDARPRVIVLVEGMLDLISVQQAYPHVYALGSSALNRFQIEWLRLMRVSGWYFDVLIYTDNDERDQGYRAALETARECSKLGIQPNVVRTPFEADDPGALVGDPRFKESVRKTVQAIGDT